MIMLFQQTYSTFYEFFVVADFDVSNQQGPGCEPKPYNAELQQWREETVLLTIVCSIQSNIYEDFYQGGFLLARLYIAENSVRDWQLR